MLDLVVAASLAFAAEKGGDTPPVGPASGAVVQAKPDDEIVVKGQKPKERRTICRTETPTGTSFSKRVCRTVAQVEEDQAQSARLIDEAGRIQTLQATTDRDNGPK